MEPNGMNMRDFKYCTYCKASHPRTEFAKSWQTKDGLNGWCKKAHKAHREAKKNARPLDAAQPDVSAGEPLASTAKSA
jgi:hypothetical protein